MRRSRFGEEQIIAIVREQEDTVRSSQVPQALVGYEILRSQQGKGVSRRDMRQNDPQKVPSAPKSEW